MGEDSTDFLQNGFVDNCSYISQLWIENEIYINKKGALGPKKY